MDEDSSDEYPKIVSHLSTPLSTFAAFCNAGIVKAARILIASAEEEIVTLQISLADAFVIISSTTNKGQ